ncbi:MAG: hypothetical protein ACRDNJ_04570 [Solirubrobacteraceae bacterium]
MGRLRIILVRGLCLAALVAAGAASAAHADDWFPHPADAQWTYHWVDSNYNPNGTTETVKVDTTDKVTCGWQLEWSGTIEVPLGSQGSGPAPVIDQPDDGNVCFEDQNYGLLNTNWSGDTPPIDEPPLCASNASQCPNSLGSVMFNVIWGARSPVISEPLLQGTSWSSTGGGDGGVTSQNQYLGLQEVKVPAFPKGILAAAVRSQIALAGTPGDDYGSGTRTTWWGYGVGPVKLVFDHVDGSVTTAELQSTNLTSPPPRSDQSYFPMTVGLTDVYQWVNKRHLPQPEIEQVKVAAAANRSARLAVKSLSGPIRAAGNYLFSLRLDGLRNTYGSTEGATLARFPKLGHQVHFFTPIDLMTYGFNPILPAYPVRSTWRSGNPRDMQLYGVRGSTRVVGVRTVKVPAGKFQALEVRSVLTQRGHRFGSGVRTMWFAPGRGLVKLVFHHRDGSVSIVQLLRRAPGKRHSVRHRRASRTHGRSPGAHRRSPGADPRSPDSRSR